MKSCSNGAFFNP